MDLATFIGRLMSLQQKTEIVPRGGFLTQLGQVERHIYIIQTGAVRAYIINEKGEELTIRFGYENNLITSIASFVSQKPSEMCLQAIRKTSLIKISKDIFEQFISAETAHLAAYNELLQQLILGQMEREIDLLTESPLGRYRRVLGRSPQLFQHVPAKYIASYLRMSPETLSRLHKKELRQKS